MSSWDNIKGVFRRTTQYINSQVRNVNEPTVDAEYDNLCQIVDNLALLAMRTSDRIKRLASCVDLSVNLVHEASLDPPSAALVWDDMRHLNFKLADASTKLQPHASYAKKVFIDHSVLLDRFVADVRSLAMLKEERKKLLLEYDFFRHKTAALRAAPPADAERIPRNEGRVMEFKQQYDAINGRLKQAMVGLMSTGERNCAQAHMHIATEMHRLADESSKAWQSANIQFIAMVKEAASAATGAAQQAMASGTASLTTFAAAAAAAASDKLASPPPLPHDHDRQQDILAASASSLYDPNRPASIVTSTRSTRNLANAPADDNPFRA